MNRKHWSKLLSLIVMGLLVTAVAIAAPKVNPKKGKVFYRNNCRVCHDGKTEGAPMLQPSEYIMDQWDEAFADEEDVAECVPRVKEKTGVELTEQDLIDIQQYLVDGAADGERPMTCG